ncbi:mannitol operon transcriptional antiterminator [Peribacillus deserti]|uniref:Mannitol operon transcriptional antiterminator n=1 Tax=Peribacillus deserti TaxID=673318 RepID=A0ABS2QEV6_9BACI|nr:PRD domain-containing protein [Peribacillus deserti]MBM7691674.1 mannitol operon transcriptional antiterminator [Peribacillus deserti]
MLITSREKSIIELIIKTSGKHTAVSIASYLQVSVRTIQRDLKSVEKVLESFDLKLTRNIDEGFMIEGKNEQVFRLIQHLKGSHPVDQTPQERKLLLLLALIQEDTYKLQALAVELGVSITTLTAYLDEITQWMEEYRIQLPRKRGVGIEIHGSEADKRRALADFFLMNFNEELIETLFMLEQGQSSEDRILYYFKPRYILEIDRLASKMINSGSSRLADSDYMGLIIQIAITMQRTEADFVIEKENEPSAELSDEFNLMTSLCEKLHKVFQIDFTREDISYLAVILKGSKLQEADAVQYDSVVLSRVIKALIADVSSQLHVDLTKDFPLFQGLLAHMEPSLFRLKQKMGLYNPLTEEIKRKYPVLFMAVKNSVEKQFPDIELFPDDEIAFIVLHFGSALVLREEAVLISALIVCPTGIGTSKMLASRVKREITEIQTIDIKSIKEIRQNENLQSYDLIISTVRLPFMDIDYILVNSLLNDDDIKTIRSYLRRNVGKLTKDKSYEKSLLKEATAPRTSKKGIAEVMQEIKDVQRSIDSILDHFRFYRISEQAGHEKIMELMVSNAEKDGLLTDSYGVMEALKSRERKGGLGIPDTGMGLFHTRHSSVGTLIFQIAHLSEPCEIQGMDGKKMNLKNLLLMLAPENLSEREQEIISLVSTSLIENKESIMIFSSSNEKSIRNKLETIFLDYIQNNLIKE